MLSLKKIIIILQVLAAVNRNKRPDYRLVLIEGLQDPWAQSGYSSMPHHQSAPFAAINPQDRLVSFAHFCISISVKCMFNDCNYRPCHYYFNCTVKYV